MSRPRLAAALVLLGAGWACSPTFNWREIQAAPTPLKALLPCKPDQGMRTVPMAGRQVDLHVLGCDTGGATFAILYADIGEPARAGQALVQWRIATLANLRGTAARDTPFVPPGGLAIPQSVQVVASGQRADGSKVQSHAAYFAHGTRVFQAVVYADELKPEQTDSFFPGLRFE